MNSTRKETLLLLPSDFGVSSLQAGFYPKNFARYFVQTRSIQKPVIHGCCLENTVALRKDRIIKNN